MRPHWRHSIPATAAACSPACAPRSELNQIYTSKLSQASAAALGLRRPGVPLRDHADADGTRSNHPQVPISLGQSRAQPETKFTASNAALPLGFHSPRLGTTPRFPSCMIVSSIPNACASCPGGSGDTYPRRGARLAMVLSQAERSIRHPYANSRSERRQRRFDCVEWVGGRWSAGAKLKTFSLKAAFG